MEAMTRAKKWGNSIGVIIPNEVIELENIDVDDELILHIEKKKNKDRIKLMKEGYIEMQEETKKINKEWDNVDKWD